MAGWGNLGMAELVEKKSTYLGVYQYEDLFQPTLEHRKIDFARSAGFRLVVQKHRNQIQEQKDALKRRLKSNQTPVTPPLDTDGLYGKIEEEREMDIEEYPL
ncbi:hypothetical protein FRC17_008647 [Serendipita sp. 399]|nr:hypothetical protein FRC17_008647 [Serendipita sp. 399]